MSSQAVSVLADFSEDLPVAAPFKVGNFQRGANDGSVSQQWFSRPVDQRFLSLTDLRDNVRTRYDRASEVVVPSKKIEFFAPDPETKDDTHKLSVVLNGNDLIAPTHWAFGQLCQRAKAPSAFMRELPSQIVADTLNYRMRFDREVEDIKLYHSPDELMAATGPTYGRVPDHHVVDAVMSIAGNGIGDTRWKVPGVLDWSTMMYNPEAPITTDSTTLYASDRDVFIFLVDDRNPIEVGKLPSGDPDLMFRGFYIQNSEVGSRSLKLSTFYLRAVCMNRNLWGVEGFEELVIRHTSSAIDRWMREAQPALNSYANGSETKLIEGVQKAKSAILAKNDDDAVDFLKARKFSQANTKKIFDILERDEDSKPRSAWDFAQGITALARDARNTDDRLELELEAKKILDKVA